MKNIAFNFVSLILLLQTFFTFVACEDSQTQDDCKILFEIIKELNGDPYKINSNWNVNVLGGCCDEISIVCDPHFGVKRIAELKLRKNNFIGTLSNKITELKYLNYFSIADNKVTGPIPENWGDLIYLTKFSFRNNSFTGSIPESVGKLESVFHMDFSDNQLTGTIPESLGNLKHLQFFCARFNNLEGYVPESFRGLKKLTTFELSGNAGLKGYVPLLDSMSNCTYIGTNLCYKEGAICTEGGHQCSLEEIKDTEENNGFKNYKEDNSSGICSSGGTCDCESAKSSGGIGSFLKNHLVLIIIVIIVIIVLLLVFFLCRGREKEEDEIRIKPNNYNNNNNYNYNNNNRNNFDGYYY